MMYVSFLHDHSSKIEKELSKPIDFVATEKLPHGEIIALRLIRQDSTVLKITNVMHEVGERVEVGRLAFSFTDISVEDTAKIKLPNSFGEYLTIYKLIMKNPAILAEVESGIIIQAYDGQELCVFAADFPYALSVEGPIFKEKSVREYPDANYRRLLL